MGNYCRSQLLKIFILPRYIKIPKQTTKAYQSEQIENIIIPVEPIANKPKLKINTGNGHKKKPE